LRAASRLLLASVLQAASGFPERVPAWGQYGLEQGRVAAAEGQEDDPK